MAFCCTFATHKRVMDQDSLLLSESGEVQQKGKEGYNAIPAVTDFKQPTLIGNVSLQLVNSLVNISWIVFYAAVL